MNDDDSVRATRPRTARPLAPGRLLLVAGAGAAALVLAACGGDGARQTGAGGTAEAGPTTTSSDSGEHNAADAMFATMMIPHHAQAVEMASTVLAKDGLDPRIAELAEQIRAAQSPEIALMTGWLRAWGEPVPDASGPMSGTDTDPTEPGDTQRDDPQTDGPLTDGMHSHGMHSDGTESDRMRGLMSEADMQALQDAPAADAGALFLEQMTEHHAGAIEMAEAEIADGRDPAAVDLARTIATSQQEEITRMRRLLDQL